MENRTKENGFKEETRRFRMEIRNKTKSKDRAGEAQKGHKSLEHEEGRQRGVGSRAPLIVSPEPE